MLLQSLLSQLQNRVFEILIFSQVNWENGHNVRETNLIIS